MDTPVESRLAQVITCFQTGCTDRGIQYDVRFSKGISQRDCSLIAPAAPGGLHNLQNADRTMHRSSTGYLEEVEINNMVSRALAHGFKFPTTEDRNSFENYGRFFYMERQVK